MRSTAAGRVRIDALYSSPLERARETAATIASCAGLDIQEEPGVTELDWGDWTGQSLDELRSNPDFHRFNVERATFRIPGGETMPEAQARAVASLERIARSEPENARVAVVSHADIIRALLVWCVGAPIDQLLRFQVAPASVSVIDVTGLYRSVRSVNVAADVVETFS